MMSKEILEATIVKFSLENLHLDPLLSDMLFF